MSCKKGRKNNSRKPYGGFVGEMMSNFASNVKDVAKQTKRAPGEAIRDAIKNFRKQ